MIVNFSSPEDARKAFEYHRMRPFDLGEGELTLRHVPVKAPSDPSENPDFSRMRRSQFLRVNGLPKFTTRDSIYHLFQPHADVKNIVMRTYHHNSHCVALGSLTNVKPNRSQNTSETVNLCPRALLSLPRMPMLKQSCPPIKTTISSFPARRFT